MVFWGWLLKLGSGFLPVDGKRIGKIIWVAVICFGCLFLWNRLVEPKTRIETIETQIINECPKDNGFFGVKINLWKLSLKLGM